MSDVCDYVRRAIAENDRTLKRAAKNSGMTVAELEDYYWQCEADARKKVDELMRAKGATPIEWRFGMNAQLMLMNMTAK